MPPGRLPVEQAHALEIREEALLPDAQGNRLHRAVRPQLSPEVSAFKEVLQKRLDGHRIDVGGPGKRGAEILITDPVDRPGEGIEAGLAGVSLQPGRLLRRQALQALHPVDDLAQAEAALQKMLADVRQEDQGVLGVGQGREFSARDCAGHGPFEAVQQDRLQVQTEGAEMMVQLVFDAAFGILDMAGRFRRRRGRLSVRGAG